MRHILDLQYGTLYGVGTTYCRRTVPVEAAYDRDPGPVCRACDRARRAEQRRRALAVAARRERERR